MERISLRILASLFFCLPFLSLSMQGQSETQTTVPADTSDVYSEQMLGDVLVTQRRLGTRRLRGAVNGISIQREELFRAACCNLGESFTTNPSVDVSYDDATTGARQIKLLGLSGTYVQMLTDNLPDLRGSAQPFALGFIPGPWMKSIQVSKGASSVKNGYESITGQINVALQPAEDIQSLTANVYGDTKSRLEANLLGNYHVNERLSTALLTHYENRWGHHDENNDGFLDQPRMNQLNVHNRLAYINGRHIFHGGVSLLGENRESGQTEHGAMNGPYSLLWRSTLANYRYALTAKHAYVLNAERGENVALMASLTMNERRDVYDLTTYNVNEKNIYAQLMYETNLAPEHNVSAGLTLTHDYLGQHIGQRNVPQALLTPPIQPYVYDPRVDALRQMDDDRVRERENVAGIYAQYTYNLNEQLVAMAGVRIDHAAYYYIGTTKGSTFVTPRFHVKWQPLDIVALRASAGKGYRQPHALAEQARMMARGGQTLYYKPEQEKAWNYGLTAALYIPLYGQTLQVNAEYYYTDFASKFLIDRDSRPGMVSLYTSHNRNNSHSLQVDATYPVYQGLTVTAAFRRNIVKETYRDPLMPQSAPVTREQPLQSRYKGLLTASYKTPLGIWQFDATLQINGSGRMPAPIVTYLGSDAEGNSYYDYSWHPTFPTYGQLSAQVTRWFRYFSVYAGGENLTGFRQKHPIYASGEPWGTDFDPTLVWGPVHGPMVYAGFRLYLEKM